MLESFFCLPCIAHALVLILVANAAPILAYLVFRRQYSAPVDLGLKLSDGRPLFGAAKTWRGLMSSVILTSVASLLLNMEVSTGISFALLAMAGDLTSSFCKRRLGLPASSKCAGLDTLPESALPAAVLKGSLGLGWIDIIIISVAFWSMEEFISPWLYKWHLRKKPY